MAHASFSGREIRTTRIHEFATVDSLPNEDTEPGLFSSFESSPAVIRNNDPRDSRGFVRALGGACEKGGLGNNMSNPKLFAPNRNLETAMCRGCHSRGGMVQLVAETDLPTRGRWPYPLKP